MSDIVSPYKNIKQYTKILLKPHQMNSDIKNNLKVNLREKVEKKCNKNGFVDEVFRIEKYPDGFLPPENLSGNVVYNIEYTCRLCLPIENTVIIAQIQVISPELILAKNGPIFIFIPRDKISTNLYNVTNEFIHIQSKKKLSANQYVKVLILNKKINNGDSQINAIGKLLDLPSDKEVSKYFGNTVVIAKQNVENTNEEIQPKQEESNFIM